LGWHFDILDRFAMDIAAVVSLPVEKISEGTARERP
jgi:hypothetical protein